MYSNLHHSSHIHTNLVLFYLFFYLLKQQRARRPSYRLLKRKTNKHYMYICIHYSQNKKKIKKTLRPHEHYIKFTVQKLTK